MNPPIFPNTVFAIHDAWLPALISSDVARMKAAASVAGRINVVGPLGPASDWYVTTAYEDLAAQVRRAVADPTLKTITLHIDSPGGSVSGLAEVAGLVAQANRIKPVTAHIGGMAASAAFWIASQASTIIARPSSEIGSIGVRDIALDISRGLYDSGIDVHIASSTPEKSERTGLVPLSEDAKVHMQTEVTRWYGDFLSAVRRGRGARVSPTDSYGAGRMMSADTARRMGLIDFVKVETL